MASTLVTLDTIIDKLVLSVGALNASMAATAPVMATVASATDSTRDAIQAYAEEVKKETNLFNKNSKAIRDARKTMKEAVAEHKKAAKATEDLNTLLRGQSPTLNKLKKGWGEVTNATKAFVGAATSVGAVVGIGAFSFKAIYDAAIDYKSGLISLTQAQVAGSGETLNLAANMDTLTDSLIISKDGFVRLARSMSETFVGIPPGTEKMSILFKKIQSQSANLKEAEKAWSALQATQRKDNAIYVMQVRNLDIAAAARNENRDQTKEEQQEIAKNIDLQRMRARSLWGSSEAINEHASLVANLNKKMRDDQDQTQAADMAKKKYKETLIDLGVKAMPLFTMMAKAATSFLKIIEGSEGKVLVLFGALAGLRGLMPFAPLVKGGMKLTKMLGDMNPAFLGIKVGMKGITDGAGGAVAGLTKLGAAGAVLASLGVGVALGTWIDGLFGISDGIARAHGASVNTKIFEKNKKDTQDYLDNIQKQYKDVDIEQLYKDMGGKEDKQTMGVAMSMKIELDKGIDPKKILEKLGKDTEDLATVNATNKALVVSERNYDLIIQAATSQLRIVGQITAGAEAQVAISEKMGRANLGAIAETIRGYEREKDIQKELVDARMALIALESKKGTEGMKVDIDADVSSFDQVNSAMEQLRENQLGLNKDSKDYKDNYERIENTISDLTKIQTDFREKESKATLEKFNLVTAEMRITEKLTSLAETRLDAETKLMESAQFGIGASVEQMQKQVALQEKLMKQREGAIEGIKKVVVEEGKISPQQADQIKNMTTMQEVKAYINTLDGAKEKDMDAITTYWQQHQGLATDQVKSQQKIYDLTKDVREGYLDAIVEMAAGAGEFSKIIGTQDKGVTQLLGKVEDVTGEKRGNTFKMGGTGGGEARKKSFGRFSDKGFQAGATKERQEEANKDIYGGVGDPRAGTTVGTSSVGTPEVRAAFQAGDTGGKERSLDLAPINPGVLKNKIRSDSPDLVAGAAQVKALAEQQSGYSKGVNPAAVKAVAGIANAQPLNPKTTSLNLGNDKSSVKVIISVEDGLKAKIDGAVGVIAEISSITS